MRFRLFFIRRYKKIGRNLSKKIKNQPTDSPPKNGGVGSPRGLGMPHTTALESAVFMYSGHCRVSSMSFCTPSILSRYPIVPRRGFQCGGVLPFLIRIDERHKNGTSSGSRRYVLFFRFVLPCLYYTPFPASVHISICAHSGVCTYRGSLYLFPFFVP